MVSAPLPLRVAPDLQKLRDSITSAPFPLPDAPDWAMESRITIDKRIAHAALHGSADDRELLDPFVAGAISEHLKDVTHEHLKVENESRLLSGYQNAIVECLRKLVPRYLSKPNQYMSASSTSGGPTPNNVVAGSTPAERP